MKVSRRKFISSGLELGLGFALSTHSLLSIAGRTSPTTLPKDGKAKILVKVHMTGGNDGINTIVPYGCGQYYKLRPSLAIKPEDLLPLNNNIGFNPNLLALNDIYQDGNLAIVLGVGSPNSSRSHFRSIEMWQTGKTNTMGSTSWLYCYSTAISRDRDNVHKVFPAINVEPFSFKNLGPDQILISSMDNSSNTFHLNTDIHFQTGIQADKQKQLAIRQKVYSSFDLEHCTLGLLQQLGLNMVQAHECLLKSEQTYKNKINYPEDGFGRAMRFIAQMITARMDITVYNVSLGGFDTHANQANIHNPLLKQFSETLAAFQKDLQEQGVNEDVLVFAFSEFGRRLAENKEAGTDHGTAAPVLIMGSAVNGGIYGDYPNLNDLDDGDLRYTVDFRHIYATFLDRWLNVDSQTILGQNFDNLPFI